MPLQGTYEPSPVQWVREQVAEYESSKGRRGTTMRGMPVILLTTVGRKSGNLRKAPLMRVFHDGDYAAVASVGWLPNALGALGWNRTGAANRDERAPRDDAAFSEPKLLLSQNGYGPPEA